MTLRRLQETFLSVPGIGPLAAVPDQLQDDDQTEDDEYLDFLEEVETFTSRADHVCQLVLAGAAEPDQIREIFETPLEALMDTQARPVLDKLMLTCVNHGISPRTGRVDPSTATLLLQAIRAGMSEQGALRHSYLAAHGQIPPQMLRDDEFVEQLAQAQNAGNA